MARDIVECDESHIRHRLKLIYPHVNMKTHPLPTRWNAQDKSNYLQISSRDTLTVVYTASSDDYEYAASIRSNHPIPEVTRLYYYETRVINAGNKGFIGVGLSESYVSVNRLPGWDPASYGYHGDDGKFFASSGKGKPYGPTFGTGDVIGCGVDYTRGQMFFTKNGVYLGIAPDPTSTGNPLYPTVGMQSPNSVTEVNFGAKPFLYDIDDYDGDSAV